jgi:hypothetical protein
VSQRTAKRSSGVKSMKSNRLKRLRRMIQTNSILWVAAHAGLRNVKRAHLGSIPCSIADSCLVLGFDAAHKRPIVRYEAHQQWTEEEF